MATYYADFVNGLDANNGLGSDASHATNKPWKTIGKLLGAAGMASGDTAYLAPGTFREAVTIAMTSATVETRIIGDPGNAQGFKTSGGVLVTPGDVKWTGYTTNDKTAAGARPLTMAGRDFLTFERIDFYAGHTSPHMLDATTTTSTDIKFRSCGFYWGVGGNVRISITVAAAVAANWLFDSCRFFMGNVSGVNLISIALTKHTAEYDANILFENCLFIGGGDGSGLGVVPTAAATFFGGGVRVNHCTFINAWQAIYSDAAAKYPLIVTNCAFIGCMRAGLGAGAPRGPLQLVENNNINSSGGFSQATGGVHTQTVYAPLIEAGQPQGQGRRPRRFGEPLVGSPLLGFDQVGLKVGAAGTVAEDATVGTIAWTTPDNCKESDDVYAVATLAQNEVTKYLKMTNLGFSIPSGATILGVQVQYEGKASAASSVQTSSVKLVKAGTIQGTDKDSAATLTTADATYSFGSFSDQWGLGPFTDTDINASDFGFVIAWTNGNASSRDVSIDFMKITVCYRATPLALDIDGVPRPSGGASALVACGCMERKDTFAKETTTVRTGSNAISITGPGCQDFEVPVDAASTTVTAYVRWDATYAGTKPRLQVLNGGECGVADATATATGSSGSWEQLSLNFTPTSKGIVTIRLLSSDTNGGGKMFSDDFAVT